MSVNTNAVANFGSSLEALIKHSLREFSFGVHESIVNGTPVDTGRARSSWNLSEDEPDTSTTPTLVSIINPSSNEGAFISVAAPGASPLTPAQATIAAKASQQNVGGAPQVVYIANAVEYIEKLENGSSRQAPNGMVAINTTQAQLQQQLDDAVTLALKNP